MSTFTVNVDEKSLERLCGAGVSAQKICESSISKKTGGISAAGSQRIRMGQCLPLPGPHWTRSPVRKLNGRLG